MRMVWKRCLCGGLPVSRLLLIGLVSMTTLVLSACNTVKGMGRDVEAVGQGGQDIIDGKH